MTTRQKFKMVDQVGRVPSMTVALDAEHERRYQNLIEKIVMFDFHQHILVMPEDPTQISNYFQGTRYEWGYDAVRHGGWTAVCTANHLTCRKLTAESAFADFTDLVSEIGLMLADMERQPDVVKVSRRKDILAAKEAGKIALVPSVEHLAVGPFVHRIEVLYGMGVRLAGLTYSRQNFFGAGQYEPKDSGLSDLGRDAVERMNDLGMIIDVSHTGSQTFLGAVEHSRAPIVSSHTAAYGIRQRRRSRRDEELLACAKKGGVIGVTAVPNVLSDDPNQDINVVLDHFDYLVKLIGVDHVAIGTDTLVGDTVGFQRHMNTRDGNRDFPVDKIFAPYVNGLEGPQDGKNIIRGLLDRGYSDADVTKIAGGNALRLFGEVVG
jgi:membrane dipeptidase